MGTRIPEVDAYIENSPEYARPILKKIRAMFHKASPKLTEVMKWSTPHFEYKGLVGGISAFKHHVGFGFWKGKLMEDPLNLFSGGGGSMCTAKVTCLEELPSEKDFIAYVKEAIRLNEEGVKEAKPKSAPRLAPKTPKDLKLALAANPAAQAAFDKFPPSHKREYIEWIEEAKREATRQKRLEQAIEWMAEGKSRNWKYENC